MSKNKSKKKKQHAQDKEKSRTENAGNQHVHTQEMEVNRLSADVAKHATDSDRQALVDNPPEPTGASVDELVTKCEKTLALLDERQKRINEERRKLEKERESLEREREQLASEKEKARRDLAESAAALDKVKEEQESVAAQERNILEREEKLLKREHDADAGFAKRNRESLAKLEEDATVLREELSKHRAWMASEQVKCANEISAKWDMFLQDIESKRAEIERKARERDEQWQLRVSEQEKALEQREGELQAESNRLRREARNIEVDKEILAEDREAEEEKIKRKAASELEKKEGEISELKERLDAARADREELARRIGNREDADRRFGEQNPEDVLADLRKLRQENDRLKKELGSRPSAEEWQRLEKLDQQREAWETERLSLLGELAECKQRVARTNIAVTELETLTNYRDALKACNGLLTKAVHDEIREVKNLVSGADGTSPFPSCCKMDVDFQGTPSTSEEDVKLKEFVEYVRNQMAYNPDAQKRLYYSARVVRSFIGGLAMSRLHLLQGISGTGKTSLPLAFARAIGAGHALIEVQAGWRDKQDLIGTFNAFEKRFHESEFLQALYKAGCPGYKKTPFVVVLDEMNLSHPEQYFADLLSALEQEQQQQRLVLMHAPVKPAPLLMAKENGRFLPIPKNVWFVGTANHDETTKDFADKTYDRAHVMELPRHREEFEVKELDKREPVGFDALRNAFVQAMEKHKVEAKKAYNFLDEKFGDILGRRFRVGWGNRLQRQIEAYVPVVIECGGSVGEATDHVLATKLLRKIRDRHDNRLEDITALREQIEQEWSSFDANSSPSESLDILAEELHRLGYDEAPLTNE